jgi:Condensation domain
VEQILVPFGGTGAGAGEPSWGQLDLWGVGGQEGREIPIGGVTPLPPGVGVGDVAAVLAYTVGRHPALRTRFEVGPDRRLVRQILSDRGEIVLSVLDVPDGGDPQAAALDLAARFEREPFDCTAQWPVRMAAVRHRAVLTHSVAVYNHLALDLFGLDVLLADVRRVVGGEPADDQGPVTRQQPLDQAAWQRSPAGIKQNDRAMRYWERLYRTVPARRFGPPDRRSDEVFLKLLFESPASWLAARAVSARLSVDVGHVLLAAFAVAVNGMTGVNPTVTHVVVGNRFRPELAGVVATVCQFGMCAIDVADATFAQVVTRTWRAGLQMYRYAYYDPRQRHELHMAVSRERGEEIVVDCYYNDRRRLMPEPLDAPPSADRLDEAVGRGRLRWEKWPMPLPPQGETLYLHIGDSPEGVEFTLCGDPLRLAPEQLEACARRIEGLLVAAALDPHAPLAATPGPDAAAPLAIASPA